LSQSSFSATPPHLLLNCHLRFKQPELILGRALSPVAVSSPAFIRDMFQESLDFMLHDNWLDGLDEDFGENNIWSEKLLSRWKHMSKRERGSWLLGKLWNDRSILPSSDCTVIEIPQGSIYAQGVRKLKDDWRQELRPDSRTAA
jgi:hypothetical protein